MKGQRRWFEKPKRERGDHQGDRHTFKTGIGVPYKATWLFYPLKDNLHDHGIRVKWFNMIFIKLL